MSKRHDIALGMYFDLMSLIKKYTIKNTYYEHS